MPVMGTCAGLILLAENVAGGESCFGTMPVTVRRNAYGRQLGSFQTVEEMKGVGQFPMTFIPVSYTHLDVYKRQAVCCVIVSAIKIVYNMIHRMRSFRRKQSG